MKTIYNLGNGLEVEVWRTNLFPFQTATTNGPDEVVLIRFAGYPNGDSFPPYARAIACGQMMGLDFVDKKFILQYKLNAFCRRPTPEILVSTNGSIGADQIEVLNCAGIMDTTQHSVSTDSVGGPDTWFAFLDPRGPLKKPQQ
jgi:hypothetical protein